MVHLASTWRELFDPLNCVAVGVVLVVFVIPAVAILAARDALRKFRRNREQRGAPPQGFDVQPPSGEREDR